MKCRQCGTQLTGNEPYCPNCGAEVGIICPSCGMPNESNQEYCTSCGWPLRMEEDPYDYDIDQTPEVAQKKNTVLIVALTICALVIVFLVGYILISHFYSKKEPVVATANQTTTQKANNSKSVPDSVRTQGSSTDKPYQNDNTYKNDTSYNNSSSYSPSNSSSNSSSTSSSSVSLSTPIMGNSGTTKSELIELYNSQSPISFPSYYQSRGVSLDDFAQMYIDECAAENVRADLAFSQMAHETGWLQFGGDVDISQFNFAGLGATGNGEPGISFSNIYGDNANGIRMGIRAQIQHLKAYGSTEPLNNGVVDPRFDLVTRGESPTIGGLSGTWAADDNFAQEIVDIMHRI